MITDYWNFDEPIVSRAPSGLSVRYEDPDLLNGRFASDTELVSQ